MKLSRQPFTKALTIIVATGTLFFVAGCLRYGGADGFLRQVQMELVQPKPTQTPVPTPIDADTEPITQTAEVANVLLPTVTPQETVSETVVLPTPETEKLIPVPQINHQLPLPSVELSGLRHEWQTWNNCGPATLSFYLSYYGSPLTQADTGSQLRRHPDDKNVSPWELADFAQAQSGFTGTVRVNGTRDLMRTFLSNGIPIIIETWLEEEPNDGMGHYRLLTGYDDAGEYWIAYDSYVSQDLVAAEGPYRGIRLSYAEMDALWKVFNRTYILVYPLEKQELVQSIFGDALSEPMMSNAAAMEQARAEIAANPNDAFAWFNLGSMLVAFNNAPEAADAFDTARRLGLPWRMLWYQFEPFAAYYQVGRFEEVIALSDATMRNVTTIEELYYWKGMALAALGNAGGAREQWTTALSLNPQFAPAQSALADSTQ